MQTPFRTSACRILLVALIPLLGTTQAFAGKPDWAGGGRDHGHGNDYRSNDDHRGHEDRDMRSDRQDHGQHWRNDRHDGGPRAEVRVHGYFNDRQRGFAHNYYGGEFRRGHCPPGLAKKHNGCLPPGQARQWRMGYPLGRDVVYYDVPPNLVVQLGYPPAGHRYVRVASDILLVAIGTGMVVDAIEDIGR